MTDVNIATELLVDALLIIFAIASPFFLKVFLIPTMYLKRVRAMEGVHIAWEELCKGHIGSAILLLLMIVLLGIGVTVAAVIVTCVTCCTAALPYVSSVVFLPIIVFFASYVLEYIQQFGSEWQFFPPMCPSCGYSRQGLDENLSCPECGKEPSIYN